MDTEEINEITKYAVAISNGLCNRYEYDYLMDHPDEFAKDVWRLAEAIYDRKVYLYD